MIEKKRKIVYFTIMQYGKKRAKKISIHDLLVLEISL